MIRSYIKSRWPAFFIIVWAAAVFSLIDYVTEAQNSQIGYGILLFVFISLFVLALDFTGYRRKARNLERCFKQLSLDMAEVEKGGDAVETAYQNMIEKLKQQVSEAIARLNADYNDAQEYYTMWVHQIKTPISALRLLVQSDKSLQDKGAYSAEIFRIEQYVEMVLQYLRLREPEKDFVFQKVDAYPVIHGCIKKYSTIFIQKHLGIEFEPFEMTFFTDEKWFAFIIEQILSNSLKYTPSGKIKIYAEAPVKNPDESFSRAVVIADEGIGIRSDDIPRIFDKGYTGYNGRLYKKSSGIGLYMAKQAAGHLGIRFEVTSAVNQGTAVKIICPVQAAV